MHPCSACRRSVDESKPTAASSFALSATDRCVSLAIRQHKRAIRLQYNGNKSPKPLPASGVPHWNQESVSLSRIPAIGEAFELVCFQKWTPDKNTPGMLRRQLGYPLEARFDPNDQELDEPPACTWPAPVHTSPMASCSACAGRPECSVPSVGLRSASRYDPLRDDDVIAKRRMVRWHRRATYHSGKDWPIDMGDVLSRRELAVAITTRRRASQCRKRAVTLQRSIPSAGHCAERAQVPLRCGLRRCKSCLKIKKLQAKARMVGPWKQFVRLSIPHAEMSKLHAYRQASRWIRETLERLKSRARLGRRQCCAMACAERPPHHEIRCEANTFDYAWCIEPHKDGYPHWHVAWSAEYVCYDYLKEVWDDVTGFGLCSTFVEKVKDPESIARYLCDYLTKANFTDDVLAVMYRRRTWASTMKRGKKWEMGFKIVNIQRMNRSALAKKWASLPSWSTGTPAVASDCRWSCQLHIPKTVTSWSISPWWEFVESQKATSSYSIDKQERTQSSQGASHPSSATRSESEGMRISLDTLDAIDALEAAWYVFGETFSNARRLSRKRREDERGKAHGRDLTLMVKNGRVEIVESEQKARTMPCA